MRVPTTGLLLRHRPLGQIGGAFRSGSGSVTTVSRIDPWHVVLDYCKYDEVSVAAFAEARAECARRLAALSERVTIARPPLALRNVRMS